MFYLDVPLDLKADEQLNYNSEIVPINEFESEVEDNTRLPQLGMMIEEAQIKAEKDDSHEVTQDIHDNVDVSSEEAGIDASPLL